MQQFNVFSKWLRAEIDIQATEPAAHPRDDAEHDFNNVDYSLLLAHIQGPLEESRLDPFVTLEQDPPAIKAQAGMYDDMKKALDAFKKGDEANKDLINLGNYFDEWMRHNQTLVDQITSHQRASSSITCGLVLEDGEVLVEDVRMVYEERGSNGSLDVVEIAQDCVSTFTAIVKKKTLNQGKSTLHTILS
jgi:anaphase-promoting complex subunit 4